MKRLTRYDEDGQVVPNHDINDNLHDLVGCREMHNRLAKYEDLGFTPEQLKELLGDRKS